MDTTRSFLLILLFKSCFSQNLDHFFRKINEETGNFSTIAAHLAWESSINPGNPELRGRSATYQKNRIIWQDQTCRELATLYYRQSLNSTQQRQYYLLCRGPKFTFDETRHTSNLYEDLQSIYSDAEVCIPSDVNISTNNVTHAEDAILYFVSKIKEIFNFEHGDPILFAAKIAVNRYIILKHMLCLKGEGDFDKMMAFSRNENVLRWLWLAWREKVGPPMKQPYRKLVSLENRAAQRNGYPNIGASWRDELEIPRLRQVCRHLYNEVIPLYSLLHGVMRFHLRRVYGDIVPERGPIPAHLLGNLWSQNWEPLTDLLLPQTIDLDESIRKMNWTVMHMAKRAEDFYQSLGLPAMTEKFWRESVFARENNSDTRCHGTSADMFQDGDFRLLYCSDTSKEDFYVLHHEFGHIQYFMAYENQPALFRAKRAEDFYQSLGLPAMTEKFWRESVFARENNSDTRCHGTSADMFQDGDFRLLYCSDTSKEDFYVLHHEFGHIQYFMAYENQPALFRQANTALHEAIGDTIMYGVLTPQHLNRLGLINDSLLYTFKHDNSENPVTENLAEDDKNNIISNEFKNEKCNGDRKVDEEKLKNARDYNNIIPKLKEETIKNHKTNEGTIYKVMSKLFEDKDMTTDTILLLKQALNKIPQIPFSLLIDEYRWKYFEGSLGVENEEFWAMAVELQGISPPGVRGEEYFDVGAKFHVPDNTPYIRYFLSSFLQHQLFEKLCKAAVFGRRSAEEPVPDTISFTRCDIYGSKAVGKILKDFMSRGHSQHWSEILAATTGEHDISAAALNRYYRPLYDLLEKFVRAHRVPIGW